MDRSSGGEQHTVLINTIKSALESLGGVAYNISPIIANYARQPIFEVYGVTNGNEFPVATVYEMPFIDFPKTPLFIGDSHYQFWFKLLWFIPPKEVTVTSRIGIMRKPTIHDYYDHEADIVIPEWNLRKRPWSTPMPIDM